MKAEPKKINTGRQLYESEKEEPKKRHWDLRHIQTDKRVKAHQPNIMIIDKEPQ